MRLTPEIVRKITAVHDEIWEELRPRMQRLARCYDVAMWNEESTPEMPFVNVADANSFIQSFQSNLNDIDPAVTIRPGLQCEGDAKTSEAVSCAWLRLPGIREAMKEASRLAMVHPHAAVRLWAEPEARSVLGKVRVSPVAPWDLLVDSRTDCWEDQRWVGVRFSLPASEIQARWGKDASTRLESLHQTYLEPQLYSAIDPRAEPDLCEVDVWEIHCSGRVYYWTASMPDEFLESRKSSFKSWDDTVFVPVYPLYYKRSSKRLMGLGLLEMILSQIEEKTLLRTHMARSIRSIARIYATRAGVLDSVSEEQLASGVDGTILKLDIPPGESVRDALVPLLTTPLSSEAYSYLSALESDVAKATPIAPFERGESIKSTATEITVLTQYTAADLKALGAVKDQMTAEVVEGFLAILAPLMASEPVPIQIRGEVVVLTAKALSGDFEVWASDAQNTPLARAQIKNETMSLFPILSQFGQLPEGLRKHLATVFDLPLEITEPDPEPEPLGREGSLPSMDSALPGLPDESLGGSSPQAAAALANMATV